MSYTKPTITGYNTSPPADDGSATEANKVKWSTIKGKLTDPAKTYADDINNAVYDVLANFDFATFPTKADTAAVAPVNGQLYYVGGTDGGFFEGITGASPATYADDGGSYCGTVFIPTGGDGSAAFRRQYSGRVKASWFGIIADAGMTYSGGWSYVAGTDQSAKINALTEVHLCIDFDATGGYWIESPIIIRGGLDIVGLGYTGSGSDFKTWFVFDGGASENAFEVDDTVFEVSHYSIEGFRIADARAVVTGGYGIFANRAVNSQKIKKCLINGFYSGSIFVGADSNDRAGDNILIEECWVFPGSNSKYAIGIGNFNNVCSIRDIYCDGDGSVVKRVNGNALVGTILLESIKHEATSSIQTIETAGTDKVFASSIVRRSGAGGATIKPVSSSGAYYNIIHADLAGTGSGDTFHNAAGTSVCSGGHYVPTLGAVTFNRGAAGTNDIRIAFDSSGDPYLSMYRSGIERVLISTINQSVLEYAIASGTLAKISNTSTTSSTALQLKTASGGGGAVLDLDRTTSDGRLIGMYRNGILQNSIFFGANSPEGVYTANVGSIYFRTNGGAGTTLYVKESGTGNTGWVGK